MPNYNPETALAHLRDEQTMLQCDIVTGSRPRMPDMAWLELLFDNMGPDLTRTLCLEDAQVFFEVGDRVRFFIADGVTMTGTVERLNPKRAAVQCDAEIWRVPYAGLDHLCAETAEARRPRAARLGEVALEARGLMDRHGLKEWELRFSAAWGRLGECRLDRKLILLSRLHAVGGPPGQVTDTILHEIAHALAGSDAGHGPAWKEIARRIGAVPKSGICGSGGAGHGGEDARGKFRTSDTVTFIARGKHWTGSIVKMNPRRAKVKCGNAVWLAPYEKLSPCIRSDCKPD